MAKQQSKICLNILGKEGFSKNSLSMQGKQQLWDLFVSICGTLSRSFQIYGGCSRFQRGVMTEELGLSFYLLQLVNLIIISVYHIIRFRKYELERSIRNISCAISQFKVDRGELPTALDNTYKHMRGRTFRITDK